MSDASPSSPTLLERTMAQIRLRIVGECVIEVGDRQIGPEAPYLFALMLVLCSERGRFIPRAELHELLFPSTPGHSRSSHNLRQLIYRLRSMGAPIVTRGERVLLGSDTVIDSFLLLGQETKHARLRLGARDLEILPSYEPDISAPLTEWVNTLRDTSSAWLRALLSDDFRVWQSECSWQSVLTTGRAIQSIDASNEEVAGGIAEAFFMTGRRHEALEELDSYITGAVRPCDELRRLRSRIARAPIRHEPSQGSFRGRELTSSALARSWARATTDASQFALVVGAPGIGKTRVATEFASHVILAGGVVLNHRCDAVDRQRPYSLFIQALPQLRAMRGSLGASPEFRPYLNLLTAEIVVSPPLEPASLESIRREIQTALLDLVESVSVEKPLLLIVDDAHCLDLASWYVLRALGDARKDTAVMILCCSRRADGEDLPTLPSRCEVHTLVPLVMTDSMALFRELLLPGHCEESELCSTLVQTGGNPYYIHALARHSLDKGATTLPKDICTLASSSYFSLDAEARTLLEACVCLGQLATLTRVQEVAEISGSQLTSALRRLEGDGLIQFTAGELRCPHALLEDALKELFPGSVTAALRLRAGICLERECEVNNYPAPLAWTAANNFIASGDYARATQLMRHCASQAAAVGEPRTAAQILLQVAQTPLPPSDRASVYDSVIDFAEAAGDRELLCSALRDRLALGEHMNVSPSTLQEMEFRILEASLQQGADPFTAIHPLSMLLRDEHAPPSLRIQAGIRLLVAADLYLDKGLAHSTYDLLAPVLSSMQPTDSLRRRAELVHQTVFGDQTIALSLVQAVLRDNPSPSLAQSVIGARRYAAFSLSRMGLRALAKPVLLADYRFMQEHRVMSEALFTLVLLIENAIADGDTPEATRLLSLAAAAIERGEPCTRFTAAGYYSATAQLALLEQRFDDVEKALQDARAGYPAIATPRMLAVESALLLRADLGKGDAMLDHDRLALLQGLYEKGASLGGQDEVVAALCAAELYQQHDKEARELVIQYLAVRRETSPLEWCLRFAIPSKSHPIS